jgi:phasin family protein
MVIKRTKAMDRQPEGDADAQPSDPEAMFETEPATIPFQTTTTEAGDYEMNDAIDMNAAQEKTANAMEKVTSFGKGNVETIMKSGRIWTEGCQELSKTMAATVQTNIDRNMEAMRALAAVRTMKDMMELRGSLMSMSFERMFADAGRLTDASLKLAREAMAPITAHMIQAAEAFKQ